MEKDCVVMYRTADNNCPLFHSVTPMTETAAMTLANEMAMNLSGRRYFVLKIIATAVPSMPRMVHGQEGWQ